MKILVLCHKIPYPPIDGGCIATLNMIQGLAKNDAEIQVLCMVTPKHQGNINKIPEALKTNIKWHQVYVDTKIKPIALLLNLFLSNKPYNAERFISNDFDSSLKQLLKDNTFNIIQLEGLYLVPYINTIRKDNASKIVLRSHNVEYMIWDRIAQEESNLLKKWYKNILSQRVKKMEMNSLNAIDMLVPITNNDAALFSKRYSGHVKVSSTGIVDEKFASAYPQTKSNNLFYIGALDWEPNQKGILWFCTNVWPRIQKQNKNISLTVAGRNAPENFSKEIEKHNVNYLGEIPDAQEYIDSNGIMIVPLFSGSGMRIKIIEAMARRKCIVTTPIGAEGIPVTHNENIIIANTAQAMIKEIIKLLSDKEVVESIGTKAFNFAKKHYKNEAITKDLLHFYKQNTNQ